MGSPQVKVYLVSTGRQEGCIGQGYTPPARTRHLRHILRVVPWPSWCRLQDGVGVHLLWEGGAHVHGVPDAAAAHSPRQLR